MQNTGHLFNDAVAAQAFITAGRARFTIVSEKTGNRFTYKVRRSKDGNVNFVSVFSDEAAEHGYTYAGMINKNLELLQTKNSKIPVTAVSWIAFEFVWRWVSQGNAIPIGLQIWHEGRCGRCGRHLTDPVSIQSGIGPECAKLMGMVH